MTMNARMIHCVKLNRKAPGLTFLPYPGELGQTIYHHVSEEAWNDWINELTRLINEGRVDVSDPKAKQALEDQMKIFLCLNSHEDKKDA